MSRDHERRLKRLEAAGGRALPLTATLIQARTHEEAQRLLALEIAEGRHQDGWPVVLLTCEVFEPQVIP